MLDSDPNKSNADLLLDANRIKLQLKTLDQEWLNAQDLFYDDDLILYGAGTNLNVDPDILSVMTIEDLF